MNREIRNGFVQHQDGDEIVLPTDRPYVMACCSCDTCHQLKTHIDDAGQVRVQIFRDDEATARLRVASALDAPRSSRRARRLAREAAAVIDSPRQLFTDSQRTAPMTRAAERRARRIADLDYTLEPVADGTVVRVPMMAMDHALVDDLNARYGKPATDAPTTRRAERRAARQAGTVDVAAITLAKLETERVMARDAEIAMSLHRPGFRCCTDDASVDLSAGERARAERILQDSEAWRDTNYAEVPQAVREGAQKPVTLPFGAWRLGTQTEGASCSVGEGERGRWVREGNFLYCRPLPASTPRVPPTNPSTDSVPRTMDAATAQRIKDEAWSAYVQDLSNAWRPQE
jgi:hypothetical protein